MTLDCFSVSTVLCMQQTVRAENTDDSGRLSVAVVGMQDSTAAWGMLRDEAPYLSSK